MFILALCVLAAMAICFALSLDGVISRRPLERLADFPFKGCPATNGVTLAFGICGVALLALYLIAGRTL
jgi:hypothetical protein